LNSGEGLVGLVAKEAEALNLPNAQNHPSFSYKPETGEEIYNSFLGVPILRAGQYARRARRAEPRAARLFEEEVEALQTTAMVLAEMIASGELTALRRPAMSRRHAASLHLNGYGRAAEGIGLGRVVLHEPRIRRAERDRRRHEGRTQAARFRRRWDVALLDRRHAGSEVARAGEHRDVLGSLPHVRAGPRLDEKTPEAVADRPDRGSRRRARAEPIPARACCARPILISASGCTISTISRTA
jgi:phosphotransferase system enzyme I (PtsP)